MPEILRPCHGHRPGARPGAPRCIALEPHRHWRGRTVSEQLKNRHPDTGWRRPAATRNRIVHGYWSVDLEILHTTAVEHCPI
ncbi:MAG: HepT-like ribonuclease domain-containing protein [Thermocrispum sp.]